MSLLLGLAVLALSGNKAGAVFLPADCVANNLALNIGLAPGQNGFVTNGQTVTFIVSMLNPYQSFSGKSCDAFGMTVTFNCPAGDGTCGTTTQTLTNNAALNPPPAASDPPTEVLAGVLTCTVPLVTTADVLKACADITVGFSHNGPTTDGSFTRHSEQPIVVRHPKICVTKSCDSAVLNAAGQVVINFSGTVTNCGDEALISVSVVNNQPAPGTVVTNISSLAAGAGTTFSGTYTNQGSICGPFPDTVTATGIGFDTSSAVTASASAECTINYNACIDVSKTCDTVTIGQANLVTALVTNCGNITLTNILVTDNLYGTIGSVALLAPGGSATFTKSVTNSTCGSFPNFVTATGTSVCGAPVQAQSTNVCVVTENPCIQVTKNCDTVVVGLGNTVSGAVTNCGNITLTNITIVDNLYGSLATVASLAPGTSQSYSKLVTNTCGSFPNVVTATGRSICGTQVSATATNTCVVTENPCIGVTKTCDTVTLGKENLVTAVVTNCGNVALHDITVADNLYGSVGTVALLAPGATATLSLSVSNACGNFTNVVTAIGVSPCDTQVQAKSTNVCVVTENACIGVTKTCDTVSIGQANLVTAVVTNCGNVPLTGITVSDNLYGSLGTIASLAAGGTATLTKSVTNSCGDFTNVVTAAGTSPCGSLVQALSTNVCVVTENPCIAVTKTCDTVTIGQPNLVTAVVTNCGNVTLTDIQITDNLYGSIGTVASLAPGGTATLTKSVSNTCGSFTNVVTASAKSVCGTPVQAQSTSVCVVTEAPCIGVTKNCPKDSLPAGTTSFVVTGIVTNCGNVALTGVTVVDDNGTVGNTADDITVSIGDIAVGGSAAWQATNTVPAHFCGSITNKVVATGTSVCGTPAGPANASCSTTIECAPPDICVTKGVVCAPPSGIAGCNDTNTYGSSAIGVAGPVNSSAFCYKVVVTNCGSDVLTNVTVIDHLLGAPITGVLAGFPDTLAKNQSVTNFYGQSYGLNGGNPSTNVNIVTAKGTGQATGIVTNDTATATAIVLPISVSCELTLSGGDVVPPTGGCQTTLSANGPITFSLTVINTGQADLNVDLNGVPALYVCGDPTNTIAVPATIFVPVGGSSNIVGCTDVKCPGANFPVSVQGTAVATKSTGVECVYDANGNAITTAVHECPGCVSCQTPSTCRTTGGGDLVPGTIDSNKCYTVETTINTGGVPDLGVIKVTHGGQLGAPYAQQDCGEVLGNPCIRGQWQHVRHYQGKGNPRDTITSLHTITPKGQFDTLDCACLPCCIDGTIQEGTASDIGKRWELCNKDDHKICGPMPRPAPDNALIWTGLGKLQNETDTAKKDLEWVVIRVYIVDRSEPGGAHPGGAVAPADIYCFQAWKTGIKVAKKPDTYGTVDVAAGFRAALGADSCAFLAARAKGESLGLMPDTTVAGQAADIVDMGPLLTGNRQIHPSTSATCP